MASTALAISEKAAVLKPYLSLILRDDLLAWQSAKGQFLFQNLLTPLTLCPSVYEK